MGPESDAFPSMKGLTFLILTSSHSLSISIYLLLCASLRTTHSKWGINFTTWKNATFRNMGRAKLAGNILLTSAPRTLAKQTVQATLFRTRGYEYGSQFLYYSNAKPQRCTQRGKEPSSKNAVYLRKGNSCSLKKVSLNCRWSVSEARKCSLPAASISFSPSQS